MNWAAALTGLAQGYTANQDKFKKEQERRQAMLMQALQIQEMRLKMQRDQQDYDTEQSGTKAFVDSIPSPKNFPFTPQTPATSPAPGQSSMPMAKPPIGAPAGGPPPMGGAPPRGFPTTADFRGQMDTAFGPGKWRDTGDYRTPEREAQLRAQGALTARGTSAHSMGTPDAPGAHDIVVPGMSPDQALALLKQRGMNPLFERAAGGQGPHIHVGVPRMAGGAPSPQQPQSAPQAAPQPQAPPQQPAQDQFSPDAQMRMITSAVNDIRAALGPNASPQAVSYALKQRLQMMQMMAALQKPQAGIVINQAREEGKDYRQDNSIEARSALEGQKHDDAKDLARFKQPLALGQIDERARVSPTGRGGAGGEMSDATYARLSKDPGVILAATTFAKTGHLPSMGYGAAMNARRTAVMRLAGEMSQQGGGIDGAPGRQAEFKANSGALNFDTKMSDQVAQFEGTASREADLALGLFGKGGGLNGVGTVANKWIQGGKAAAGDPDVVAFDGALTSFKNEYAKIMAGSFGNAGSTDTARREADQLINRNMSPQQIRLQIATMKKSMQNRAAALKKTVDERKDSLQGGQKADPLGIR